MTANQHGTLTGDAIGFGDEHGNKLSSYFSDDGNTKTLKE
jgi:hypothetical protein